MPALVRSHGDRQTLLLANLSPQAATSSIDATALSAQAIRTLLRSGAVARLRHERIEATLDPYGVIVLELR